MIIHHPNSKGTPEPFGGALRLSDHYSQAKKVSRKMGYNP